MDLIEASFSGTFRTILVLIIIWWLLRVLLRRQAARGPQQSTTDRRPPGDVRIEPSSLGGRTRHDDASRSTIIDADFEEVK